MKRPSFQFYPGDWINDAALRLVSVGARGAWIDMLCLMHQGTPYGHLKVNHKVILAPNLARMLGATLAETEGWLRELHDAGVFDLEDDGGIISRRMVRDEELRQVRAAGGKLGGNPALTQAKKDKAKVGNKVNLQSNLQTTPSSSSSSSSSKEQKQKHSSSTDVDGFAEFWSAYPRKVGKANAQKAWAKIEPDPETVKDMLAAIAVQRESEQWTKHDGQFIPHPATWLNGRRWEDEVGNAAHGDERVAL